MFDDVRKTKLYELVENRPYHYSFDDLGEILSISPRTVRKEIKDINDLEDMTGLIVLNKRGKGYYISITNQEKYQLFKKNMGNTNIYFDVNNQEERAKQFILLLLNYKDYVSIEEIADQMYVSRTTIMNELGDIRNLLKKYHLMLTTKIGKGVKIAGKERDKRFVFLTLIDEELNEEKVNHFFEWKNSSTDLYGLKEELPIIFSRNHIYLTDNDLSNLIYHILIMVDRISSGFVIDNIRNVSKTREHLQFMKDIKELLTNIFHVEIPQSELEYLYVQIKSKVIYRENLNFQLSTDVNEYIHALLTVIKENYYYNLLDDEQLKYDLTSHVSSMLYRVENEIRVRNPLLEHIKKYYPLAYEITMFAVNTITNDYNYEVNNGEIAYLALHIGASLERNYQVKYKRHNSCLIVCGSGFGTARMIETSIKRDIPGLFITKTISAQKYTQLEYIEEDVVITTISIKKKNKPVFKIETLPSKRELLELDRKITNEVSKSVDIFCKYFSSNLFIKKSYNDKIEVIRDLVKVLYDEQVINDSDLFMESILKREELGSTVMGEGVAIPHPIGLLDNNRTKIATAILDKPIEWGKNRNVQLVFLLAISKQDYEDALGIYDFFVDVVRENHHHVLSNSKNFNDFILKSRLLNND
ncbi:BglG family transcription antiterminator [Bacillus kwashiorkori]|uniref:BglG family transcription antiterminator n=1 Tax=Bacillus kwashiorkori TaxID=1522318 RepID=UPI000781E4CB|nr:BglG family transcription antiterminator [Bacillus kwashiorkori]